MSTEKSLPKWIASMTEDWQKLFITLAIFYASEHPEVLTDSVRKELEEFANSAASLIEKDK